MQDPVFVPGRDGLADWQKGIRKNCLLFQEIKATPSEVGGETHRAGRGTWVQRPHLTAASTTAGLAVALLPLECSGFAIGLPQHFPGQKI